MTPGPGPGIEPGTHWWEASALTTAPTLLPKYSRIAEYFSMVDMLRLVIRELRGIIFCQ